MKYNHYLKTSVLITSMLILLFFSACQKSLNSMAPQTKQSQELAATTAAVSPPSLDTSAMLGVGLQFYYPLSGMTYDMSGYQRNGLARNIQPTTDRCDHYGGAYYFNGNSGYVSCFYAKDIPLTNTDFTLSAWIKLNDYNATGGSNIIDNRKDSKTNVGWSWNVSSATQANPKNVLSFSANQVTIQDNKIITAGTWHLVNIVYSIAKKQLTFFVDGVADTTNNVTVLAGGGQDYFYIGRHKPNAGDGGFFHGSMSDVRIYSRQLTNGEIQQLYKKPTAQTGGLIAYWPYAGTEGDIVKGNDNSTGVQILPGTDRFGNTKGASSFTKNSHTMTTVYSGLSLNNTDFTINFWTQGASAQVIKTGSWSLTSQLSGTNGQIIFESINGSDSTLASTSLYPLATSWQMVTAVYRLSDQSVTLYSNGVKQITGTAIVSPDVSQNNIIIYGNYKGMKLTKGSLSDIRIFDRVLSPKEVAQLYEALD